MLSPAPVDLPPASETGALGIYHLKRLWARAMASLRGAAPPAAIHERHLDTLVIHACGVGLEQTAKFFRDCPTFDDFERWIVTTTGGVDPVQVARINAAVTGAPPPPETTSRLAAIDASEPVLSGDDLAHWRAHGYVVLQDAVPAATRDAAAQAIYDHVGARPGEPDSWYVASDHGIMVQLFQDPAFAANRNAPRVHKAFAQLWGTADLWATTDRGGFNVPERPNFKFRGPDLHWDISVKTPIPFFTGGILYLADTPPEQGAFTVVPGFHRWGEDWLKSLPDGADPRGQDLHALGSIPVGGRAGDLVIWHLALPHGASPNRGTRPRLVQYINMFPAVYDEQDEWI